MDNGICYKVILLLAFFVAAVPAWARFEPVTCSNNPFTQEQEIAEGDKVAAQVYKQMPVLPDTDPVARYIQNLGARLVAQAPLVAGVTRQWPFNFHVVASGEINAFAVPGGTVFVNLGTIQAAENEAQLAGVMAHEISHDIMRHSTCNLVHQQRKGLFYSLGQLGSSIVLGNGALGEMAQAGLGMGERIDFLHMSRDDEKQADLLGVNLLNDAGYDPRGLPQFFEIIQSKTGSGGAQFLSDHPNPGNRTQYLNAEIETLPRHEHPVVRTAAFDQMHAIAGQRRALSAAEVKAGGWKETGQYATQRGMNGPGQPTSGPQQSVSAAISPVSTNQLGLRDRLITFQAPRWSIQYPSTWQQTTERQPDQTANGQAAEQTTQRAPSVTLYPAGGAGSFGVAYGVVIGIEQEDGDGVTDAASLSQAASGIVQRFLSGDGSMSQSGGMTSIQVDGQPALAVELRGTSPVRAGNGRQPERDLLIMVARRDGDVSYLIFVAPQASFPTMEPLFHSMLKTFSPR